MSYAFISCVLQLKSNGDLSEHVKSCSSTTISTTTMPIVTKLGRVMSYYERLPSLKSYNPLITWSCEITQQTKNHYISTTRVSLATMQDSNLHLKVPTHKVA